MSKQYRLNLPRRVANVLMKGAIRLGFGPRKSYLLSVRGRRTGKLHTTPVNLVFRAGDRYLVAPYGATNWVKNARHAGHVRLRRGRTEEQVAIEAVADPAEAAPVLHQYWRENAITRPYFDVPANPADQDFLEEADAHPVFRIR